jgi:hypothetical protein
MTVNLTGVRFGRLTAIKRAGHVKRGNSFRVAWQCVCDCGSQVVVSSNSLRTGNTRSCGCLHRDMLVARSTKHGASYTAEYRVHQSMLKRCYCRSATGFEDYGGRGIGVCDKWRFGENGTHRFVLFRDDVGLRPECTKRKKWSLDRISNNGDYEPNNVRWATRRQQNRNKRYWRRS